MPTVSVPNVRIAGIAAAVPALETLSWADLGLREDQFLAARQVKETPWRRMAKVEQCQSDFCVEAAKPLLAQLGWQASEIEVVVMATLTPDYPIPATAIIVQDRLGATKSVAAFDLPSGGLGFLHGLQLVASMLSNGSLKKALLLTGEVSKTPQDSDSSLPHRAVHGHSGSVCALEYVPDAPNMYFDAGGDGSMRDVLCMPVGGVRNPPSPDMFHSSEGARQAGSFIFDSETYGLTAARELPASMRRVSEAAGISTRDFSACYVSPLEFHFEQAIRKEMGIAHDRFHGYLPEFGASGSGSIPLAMISRTGSTLQTGRHTLLFSSVGPGLAWGSAVVTTDHMACPELLEI